jgi:hypothetical protein
MMVGQSTGFVIGFGGAHRQFVGETDEFPSLQWLLSKYMRSLASLTGCNSMLITLFLNELRQK